MTAPVDRLAFSGRWEARGGVMRPIVDAPTPEPELQPHPQDRPAIGRRCEVPGHRTTYRTAVCGCGCLIVVGESCPACLAWGERVAVLGSWRAAERANRRAS